MKWAHCAYIVLVRYSVAALAHSILAVLFLQVPILRSGMMLVMLKYAKCNMIFQLVI